MELFGRLIFIGLLAFQTVLLVAPIELQNSGVPYSRSAEVAAPCCASPELSGAIVMGDPDTVLETLPYYVNNPLWFLRQQRFGKVVRLSEDARRELSLNDILADAERLHRQNRTAGRVPQLPQDFNRAKTCVRASCTTTRHLAAATA